jgi:hypothetical protein
VDLVSTLPSFSATVHRSVAGTGTDVTGAAPSDKYNTTSPVRGGLQACVRKVAAGPLEESIFGPASKYQVTPVHKTYGWYKHYGFAGRGAKTSWGYNPKRVDIGQRYREVKGAGEQC